MDRSGGTPMITYGVEIMGVACTKRQETRRMVAQVVAPETGGKNAELTLYLADGSTGTLDPLFAAHGVPVHSWALVLWGKLADSTGPR